AKRAARALLPALVPSGYCSRISVRPAGTAPAVRLSGERTPRKLFHRTGRRNPLLEPRRATGFAHAALVEAASRKPAGICYSCCPVWILDGLHFVHRSARNDYRAIPSRLSAVPFADRLHFERGIPDALQAVAARHRNRRFGHSAAVQLNGKSRLGNPGAL